MRRGVRRGGVNLAQSLAAGLVFVMLATTAVDVSACGWWGDSEIAQHGTDDEVLLATPPANDLAAATLPDGLGYGLAVMTPGEAIPYLRATRGRVIPRIAQFKSLGFAAVIDLGTPPPTALLHQAETEAAGMRYFSIPVTQHMPTTAQMAQFADLVSEAKHHPLLIFAHDARELGVTWASYRLGRLRAPHGYALAEGRRFGMSAEQEALLLKHFPPR